MGCFLCAVQPSCLLDLVQYLILITVSKQCWVMLSLITSCYIVPYTLKFWSTKADIEGLIVEGAITLQCMERWLTLPYLEHTFLGAYMSSVYLLFFLNPTFPFLFLFLFIIGNSLYLNVFYLVLQLFVGQKTYTKHFSLSIYFNLYFILRSKVVKMTIFLFQFPKLLVISWFILVRWIILIRRLFTGRGIILIHWGIFISWFRINT